MTEKINDFSFEKLEVWKKAIDYSVDIIDLTEGIDTERKHFRLSEQIEASVASISANIAEGKGRFSKKEFVRSLYIARGSLFETITFLTIFFRKEWITSDQFYAMKKRGAEIGKMLSKLASTLKESSENQQP